MDPSSWSLLILYVAMIVGAGYFAAAETAFSSVNRIRLMAMQDEAGKRATAALAVLDRFNLTLTTLLIGTNLLHAGCAAVATIFAVRVYGSVSASGGTLTSAGASALATAITTIAVFLFSEMLPKSYAQDNAESLSLRLSGSVRFFTVIFYPFSVLFLGIDKLLTFLFPTKNEPTVTEEELSDILDTTEEEGVLDEDAVDLLQSALDFDDTRVADVLTLRADVQYLLLTDTKEEILRKIHATPYSRLPVCRTSLDDCVGILVVTDFLNAVIDGTFTRLKPLLRKPFFTFLDASIDDLQDEMTGKRQHMALVRGRESDAVLGIVTIEDFVEELVGEIYDENDKVDDDFMKLGGNYFRVSGRTLLSKMYARMGYTPDRQPAAHKNVSAWVLEKLGKIPEEGDSFEDGKLSVEVEETEQSRVLYATVKLADPTIDIPEEPEGGEEA